MLTAKEYERLARFRLAMRYKANQNTAGNRKSTQKGSSTEFSDFREYQAGDDVRRIDWNAYARTERLFVKEYAEEKETVLTILVDSSASMNFGEKSKAALTADLVEALAYLALSSSDRVILVDLKHPDRPYPVSGGRKMIMKVKEWMEDVVFSGTVDVSESIRKLEPSAIGVTVLLSDFLEEDLVEESGRGALQKSLAYLRYRKQQVYLLQVLTEEELRVDLTGTYYLIDSEDGSKLRVTMDNASITGYESAVKGFTEGLAQTAKAAGAGYVLVDGGKELRTILFEDLKEIYEL
ncbi:MAG: DUF58 domain-containing protein [Lachnospiraceae bacterium]|nr:DUF58 domain-containing protein [Lachnospiraceae bacterium]